MTSIIASSYLYNAHLQVIKVQLLASVSLRETPELVRLLEVRPQIILHIHIYPKMHTLRVRSLIKVEPIRSHPTPIDHTIKQHDEDLDSLLHLPPEAILLRWMNHHLQQAAAGGGGGGAPVRVVSNFGR